MYMNTVCEDVVGRSGVRPQDSRRVIRNKVRTWAVVVILDKCERFFAIARRVSGSIQSGKIASNKLGNFTCDVRNRERTLERAQLRRLQITLPILYEGYF